MNENEYVEVPDNAVEVAEDLAGGQVPDLPLLGVVTPAPAAAPARGSSVRVDVLRDAAKLITGERQEQYGPPEVNFARIAALWNVQLADILAPGAQFTPSLVALALMQLKAARAVQSPGRDTMVDLAGYAAIAAELYESGL